MVVYKALQQDSVSIYVRVRVKSQILKNLVRVESKIVFAFSKSLYEQVFCRSD
jgi:hypothetical protein